jgi:hypothetical protein
LARGERELQNVALSTRDWNRLQDQVAPIPNIEIAMPNAEERESKSITRLAILGSIVGAVLVVAAVEYIRQSRKTKEPIQLAIDKNPRT